MAQTVQYQSEPRTVMLIWLLCPLTVEAVISGQWSVPQNDDGRGRLTVGVQSAITANVNLISHSSKQLDSTVES